MTKKQQVEVQSNTWLDLFEDTVALAFEEGATRDCDAFVKFMHDMLPEDVMSNFEDVCGSSSILEDIWCERYKPRPANDEEEFPFEFRTEDRSCVMCERDTVALTRHHVYPREIHSHLLKKGMEKEQLNHTIAVCGMCHSAIHRFFTNEELAEEYNTLDKLLSNEKMFRFAAWASSQTKRKHIR
mmetsp:Transcript_78969/g.211966  ORF Transcript_78969/g.211966 Transcript_78969/m.211966 type:complete len:184 (+) Transcript_78969:144-695(+)|eukprot:CAMPEP_0113661536 /NCGR_PEP_ID=MMETSP0038_2-20120614/25_1 /TAXON_ID=2898 /ORGANISM="Cryptomonas paramecium" /LENGTH=183 /DNA_ID=CAMNT_0000576231 /DNA_START=94 /DNA_END=645 /DNA_ORIENTATION=- /assembly_acc=CAM_ASM_000170